MRPSFSEHSLVLRGPYLGKMTDDEFFDFCQQHPELRIERTANHEILIMSPTGSRSGKRNFELLVELGIWHKANPLGEAFDSSTGFTLPDGSVKSPDASWVAAEKWSSLTLEQQSRYAPLCPDFIVELASESDEVSSLQQKMLDWQRNGARLAWLIVPKTETAYIYRAGQLEPEVVQGFDQELSGEEVLQVFRLRLAELR
ncbi:Uma2 family endonuclease [Hymenobacter sp. GOD-10R]|uniref:Uma2 family endonuclease n=1 Tax=Hymenobacter sp. GOD-10R TaxID=3093922 RepID=UPI002D792186|nr:Uma2 family endonuclease [Hymenobacter sp. GOD-10R]WRQ26384.1 Uma2 family endonuclease [Hymenobacter sp. GOD-10R]